VIRNKKTNSKQKNVFILLNKPFNMLSQFSSSKGEATLSDLIKIPHVYPAGRLDKDSEGLLLLTNNGKLQHKISDPKYKMLKTYWVQVDGMITQKAIKQLTLGVSLNDGMTQPAMAKIINIHHKSEKHVQNKIWDRNPPIRIRQHIPTSWVQLCIREGKNRQVRRMTAAVGFPTLRLIRISIGSWHIGSLRPNEFKILACPLFKN
jgi:23S rRNA pseudouridine2457 synthase